MIQKKTRLLLLWLVFAVAPTFTFAEEYEYSAEVANRKLAELFHERLGIMKGVAAYKWKHKAPISVPHREVEILAQITARAERLGMDGEQVRQLWKQQFELSKQVQMFWHRNWKQSGFSGVESQDIGIIRQRINGIDQRLMQALYRALPSLNDLHSQDRLIDLGELGDYPVNPDAVFALAEKVTAVTWLPYGRIQGVMERIRGSNLLRVGTTGDYPPFSYYTVEQGFSGIDIEMARKLAKALTVDLMFVKSTWPTLESDLSEQRFDVAMSGVTITRPRSKVGYFSDSYHSGGKSAIGRCEDASRYTKRSQIDQSDVRLIVNPGGTNMAYVDDKIKRAQVIVFDDNTKIFGEILADKADVMITDEIEVLLQSRRHDGQLCKLLRKNLTKHNKGYWTPKNSRLSVEINILLERLRVSGQLDSLIEENLSRFAKP